MLPILTRWLPDMSLYFSYGSNLCIDQMRRRCPDAIPVQPLTLEHGQLVFRSVADAIVKQGGRLQGGLWRLSECSEATLDRHEGVRFGLYVKRHFMVSLGQRPERCLFYQMQVRGVEPPTQAYLDMLLQGYRDFGLDENLLMQAVHEAFANKNRCAYLRWRRQAKGFPRLADRPA